MPSGPADLARIKAPKVMGSHRPEVPGPRIRARPYPDRVAGYPPTLVAVQAIGLLSIEPGPAGATEATGRYVVVGDHVMFVTEVQNHAAALTGSGLSATADDAGYYTARRATATDPWRFISISYFGLGGNRAAPDPAGWMVARNAFRQSAFGDVSNVLSGPRS